MKKSLFAKILILILCFSMVLCGCNKSGMGGSEESSGGSGGKSNSPEKQMVNAFGDTLSAIFADGASTDVLEKALKAGKITVTVGDQVENVLYIDSENMNLADELKVNMDGVELEAEVYLNEEALVVALPDIVDKAYGVNFNTLMSDLENSPLWDMLDVDYDDVISELDSYVGDMEDMMEKLEPLMEGFGEALEDALECVNSSVTQGTVKVDGKDVKANIITYSLTNQELEDMVNIMLDYAQELTSQLSAMGGDLGDMASEIDDAREDIVAALGEVEVDFNLVTNINASTGYMMTMDGALTIVMNGEEGVINLDADFGENAAEADSYTIYLTATQDGETRELLSVVLDRKDNGSVTDYELNVSADGDQLFKATLSYNSSSSAYSLTAGGYYCYYDYYDDSYYSEWDYITVDGTYKLTDDYFEFSVASIESDGYREVIDVKIVIEAISTSQIPKAPSYTNILTMSTSEWEKLIGDLEDFAG